MKNEYCECLKRAFFSFCKFLSDEVETIFWESETKHSKLFESVFGYRKFLRKWFGSYLELKNECSERLERPFFSFLQSFEWQVETIFRKSKAKRAKLFKSKFGHKNLLRK